MFVSQRLCPKKPLYRNRFIVMALAIIFIFSNSVPLSLFEVKNAEAAAKVAAQAKQKPVKKTKEEIVSERTAEKKVFANPDGTRTAEVHPFPVHYKDDQGAWQDIDTNVTDTGSDLKADKTAAKTTLKKQADDQGAVGSIQVAGRTVTLKAKDAKGIRKQRATREQRGVRYRKAYEDADLRYEITSSGLKEEIVLTGPKGPSQYRYELTVDNADVRKTAAGDLEFVEPGTGTFLFKLPKPYMYDNSNSPTAARTISENVSYDVAKRGNSFDITLKADKAWLKDAARKYPITIDPTITLNQAYYDAFVDTCSAGTPHYSEVWMLSGTNTGCTRRSYLWFANLPTLPRGASITEAKLRLYQYEVSNPNSTATVCKVNQGWNATTLTWNAQPSSGAPCANFNDGSISNNFVQPDVKDIVTSWSGFGGSAVNAGFMISMNPESGAGSSTRTWRTGNYSDSSQWPKLSITYTAPYSAELVGTSAAPSSIAPGETYQQTFSYKNTGTNVWYADGVTPIRLGTDGPHDRADAFYTNDGHWVSPTRVKMDQQLVRPGETATFTMTMTAPSATGTYNEDFGIVAEGYSWLEQPTGVDVNVVGTSYASAWQGQGGNLTLKRGETSTVWIDIKNTGNKTWKRDGPNPIRLGTSNALNRSSQFVVGGDWVSANRPTNADKDKVAPGETARFSFTVRAPDNSAPGTYNEYFRPLLEGQTWLTDQGIYLPITVTDGSVATEWNRTDNNTVGTSLYLNGDASYTNQKLRKKFALPTVPSGPMELHVNAQWNDAQVSDNVFNSNVRIYAKVNNGTPQDITSRFQALPEGVNRDFTVVVNSRELSPGDNYVYIYATDPSSGYREHINVRADTGGSDGSSHRTTDGGSTWTQSPNELMVYLVGVDNIGNEVPYAGQVGGVNVTTGNLALAATDINLAAKGPDLKVNRLYNSQSRETGVLGAGWQFDFEQRLMLEGSKVRWIAEDGQQFVYTDAGSGTYTRPANTKYTLTKSDPLLGPVTYTLKDKKNLKTVFDANGRLKEITDQNDNTISFTYTNNKVSKITDPSGRESNLVYNAESKLASITDFANRTISYSYTNGLLTRVTDARNNSSAFIYDASRRLTEVTDPRGNKMRYEYDALGRVAKITDAKELENLDLSTRKTTRFAYDSTTQTSVTDAKDAVIRYTFDGLGRTQSIINASVTPNTTRSQTWDKDFNLLSETNPSGGQKQSEYDASGNPTRETDELGAVTLNTYDADFNNLLTTTDPKGVQKKNEYDAKGNQTKEYADYTNKPTEFTTFQYDGSGNQTKLTDPKAHETQFEYDAFGRLTKEKAPPQTDPKVTEYTYDLAGNKLTVKDPKLNTTTYEYNANNQQTKETDPLGNVTTYLYDANGNKIAETDAKNQTTTYQYDKLNQLTKTTSPDPNKKTDYQYDKTGNVTQVTDGKGQNSTVAYDTEDKPVSETTNNVTTNITYNASGDVTQTTEGSGATQSTTTLTVDTAGQETKEATQVGGGAVSTTNNTYDANGNVTDSTNLASGTTKAEYDGKEQVKKETDTAAKDTNVQYDPNGNVTNLTLPSGKVIAYTYDQNDQLTGSSVAVTANGANQNIVNPVVKAGSSTTTEASGAEYDKSGNVTKITKSNGTYSEMTYDTADKITGLTTKKEDGSVIVSYSYTYDANGNITQAAGDGVTTNYTYDNLDELTAAADNQSRNWAYTYDATGNRTQTTGPSGTTAYTYGDTADKNRLTSSTKNGVTTTYGYDTRGNNTSRSDGTVIAYDANNLVTSAKVGAGPTVSYVYDTDKRMVARTVNGTTTRYQYDGDKLSAETDNAGTITVAYSYDDKGRLVSQTRSNKVYYYHYDGHGNVTALSDPSGTVVKQYQYDPFGNVLSETGQAGLTNSFTYSSYFQDPDTKLYLLQARAYDPTLGRFLSVDPDPSNDDPKEDATLNANLYLYTNNNPVTNTDPTGTGFWSKVKQAAKALVKAHETFNPLVVSVKVIKNDVRAMANPRTSWKERGWIAFGFVPGVGRAARVGRAAYGARGLLRTARTIRIRTARPYRGIHWTARNGNRRSLELHTRVNNRIRPHFQLNEFRRTQSGKLRHKTNQSWPKRWPRWGHR